MATTESHDVGHPQIDAQHQAMLRVIAELTRAVEARDAAGARTALSAMWDEAIAHFATEDLLMEEFAYPERNPHRTAHHLFLEDLKELLRAFEAEGFTEEVVRWALHRVPEWIAFHVQTNDAPLARYIAQRMARSMLRQGTGDAAPGKPPGGRGQA